MCLCVHVCVCVKVLICTHSLSSLLSHSTYLLVEVHRDAAPLVFVLERERSWLLAPGDLGVSLGHVAVVVLDQIVRCEMWVQVSVCEKEMSSVYMLGFSYQCAGDSSRGRDGRQDIELLASAACVCVYVCVCECVCVCVQGANDIDTHLLERSVGHKQLQRLCGERDVKDVAGEILVVRVEEAVVDGDVRYPSVLHPSAWGGVVDNV